MQTHQGLNEFSSALLHVHISQMTIIVCYRLDQFAFNPDLGSKEDCGMWRKMGTGSLLLCCSSFSSVINHHLTFSPPDIQTMKGRHKDTPSQTPQGTLCSLGHPILPPGGRRTFPMLLKMGRKGVWSGLMRLLVSGEVVFMTTGKTPSLTPRC